MHQEQRRVQALRDLKILDTPAEERYDRLTRELAEKLHAPVAYISLIDGDRQWLKSKVGEIATEVERTQAFCNHTILQDGPLVVPNATQDPRFANLDFVTGKTGVRFYAGAPIKDLSGCRIGTVCVADQRPRKMESSEIEELVAVAERVALEINALPTVFLSYASEDQDWVDRFLRHCEALRRQGLLDLWHEREIRAGEAWQSRIRQAIERSKAAVLLVSIDFLFSDFLVEEEIPRMLERRDREGLRIFPVLVDECPWESISWLAQMRLWPGEGRTIAGGDEETIEADMEALAGAVADSVRALGRVLQPEELVTTSAQPGPDRPPAEPEPQESPAAAEPLDDHRVAEAWLEGHGDFGSFRARELISPCASGWVLRAADRKLDREVAIKMLAPDRRSDPEARAGLEREARILASVRHANVVSLYSLEEQDGVPFLVLEELRGETLAGRLERGPLAPDDARRYGALIAQALGAAHRRGITLRNLTPSGVMVSEEDGLQVHDFGLARVIPPEEEGFDETGLLNGAGISIEAAAYSSPERLRCLRVDRRTDVWSFGCILYAMLTGNSPFRAANLVDTLAAVVTKDPDWQELPSATSPEIQGVLARCLERDLARRYASMEEVEAALQASGPRVSARDPA